MRKLLLISALLVWFVCPTFADDSEKFSPEKFQAEMEQFITQEAKLTNEEASRFFPLLREMHAKQRAVYEKIKKECSNRPSNEAECKKIVQKRDVYELELKTIQQTYHNKFFKVLPALKVYDAIMAEDRFHRRAFRNWGNHRRQPPRR
ncbi:MAG: hypothetical protein J6W56_06805 [Prevotella sp.]|nr:hypothetical protein [Prevotella sp.]